MLDRSLVGFRSILVEWQLKTNFGCYSIWVGPLYTTLLIRGQSAAIRGLDRGGAEGNPRGAAGAGGNPRNPPALQIREARMNTLVSGPQSHFSTNTLASSLVHCNRKSGTCPYTTAPIGNRGHCPCAFTCAGEYPATATNISCLSLF